MIETEGLDLVFDTFAWLEHLGDGPHAARVEALHQTRNVGTPMVVLAELAHIYEERAPHSRDRILDVVARTSHVLPLTAEVAIAAGAARARLGRTRKGIGLVDCLILETARSHGAKVVTGDPHLKGLEGVEFLG